jgi:hypothetical protein
MSKLSDIIWEIQDNSVQELWNSFKNKLIKVVDTLIPMSNKEHHKQIT